MKTFQIKVTGTAAEVKDFTQFLPQRAIVEMTGMYPNHNAPEVHRYITLETEFFAEVADLTRKLASWKLNQEEGVA